MQLSVWEKPVDLRHRGDLSRILRDPPHKRKRDAAAGSRPARVRTVCPGAGSSRPGGRGRGGFSGVVVAGRCSSAAKVPWRSPQRPLLPPGRRWLSSLGAAFPPERAFHALSHARAPRAPGGQQLPFPERLPRPTGGGGQARAGGVSPPTGARSRPSRVRRDPGIQGGRVLGGSAGQGPPSLIGPAIPVPGAGPGATSSPPGSDPFRGARCSSISCGVGGPLPGPTGRPGGLGVRSVLPSRAGAGPLGRQVTLHFSGCSLGFASVVAVPPPRGRTRARAARFRPEPRPV